MGKFEQWVLSTKVADAWRAILNEGGARGDQLRFLQRFGRVMGLPLLVRDEVSKLTGIDHEIYLRWIAPMEQAFLVLSLNGTIADMHSRIDQSVLERLEICADLLCRQRPETIVDPKDLAEIKKEVDELRRNVETADIELSLREYLCRHLDDILTAVQDYDMFGIAPLQRAVQATIGSAVLNQEQARKVAATPAGKRLWEILSHIALVLTLTNSVLQITARVENLLQPAGSVSAVSPAAPMSDRPHRPNVEVVDAGALGPEKSS